MAKGKQFYRSSNAVIGGVCGGIADYFEINVTLVRVIAVLLLVFCLGSPVLVYSVLWLVSPVKPITYASYVEVDSKKQSNHIFGKQLSPFNMVLLIAGVVLVLFGLLNVSTLIFGQWWAPVINIFAIVTSVVWAITILVTGGLLIYASRGNKFGNKYKNKTLCRSVRNRKIAGVCAGLASFFGVEVSTVRLIAILLLFFSGGLVLVLYLLLWWAIPNECI
jgi:phage shock protein C